MSGRCSSQPDGFTHHSGPRLGSTFVTFTQDTPNINWPANLNRPSYVTLGAHTGVIVYSGLNFTGQQRTFTSNTNFCFVSYPNGAGVNDNVLSLQLFLVP